MAGMGGGILLVLALSLTSEPLRALALTAPALLISNLHRLWLYREALDGRVAGVFVLGAFPGALLGSLLAVSLPPEALPWILLGVSLLAVARGAGWLRWTPGPRSLAPAGFVVGGVAATSGAGMFVSPILLAAGLRGDAFIATVSASAAAMHVARVIGYGAGGLVDPPSLLASAMLASGLFAGNFGGRHLRRWMGDDVAHGVSYGVMATIVVLALAGVV